MTTNYKGYDLDPQLVEVLMGLDKALEKIPPDQWSPEREREQMRQKTRYLQSLGSRRANDVDVKDCHIPGSEIHIPVRAYRPKNFNEPLPAILYFHGGAWIRGDLDTHDDIAGRLAGEVGCVVISIDYRLAPENMFPAAVDDGFTVLKWISKRAEYLNIDGEKIAVCGDSAGGNIAAALALMTKNLQGPGLIFQLLMYPVLDLSSFDNSSYIEHGDKGFGLSREMMIWARDIYLSKLEDRLHPFASPLLAEDCSGLPPAKIITAEYDPLRDEGQAYADKLQNAGVNVSYSCYPKMIHGMFGLVGIVDACRTAMDDAVRALKISLGISNGKVIECH